MSCESVNGLHWSSALSAVNNLSNGACGLIDGSSAGDWRMPNVQELESIFDGSQVNPSLPSGHPFTNWGGNEYMTSTTANSWNTNFNQFWAVDFYYGTVRYDFRYKASYGANTWPVRGGQFGNAHVSVSPASLDYGCVQTGNKTVVITNSAPTGSSRLQINAISLSGNDSGQFSLNAGDGTNGTCGKTPILSPGASCTVNVNFIPTSAGDKSATLSISSNDLNAPNVNISLTGNRGVTATGYLTSIAKGTFLSPNPVTVCNGGSATFTVQARTNCDTNISLVSSTCPFRGFEKLNGINTYSYTSDGLQTDCSVTFDFKSIDGCGVACP
jgi:hypothetical protein